YKAWFSSLSEKQAQKIFRLSNNHPYKNSLNNIKDVNIDFFQKNYTKGNMPQIVLAEKYNISENEIKYFFEKNCSSDAYLNEVFPFDYLLYKRSTSEGDKKNLFEKILQKNEELIKKIWRII
ncbi:MAG: hypothetical protein IKI31_04590, partial [Treponema sp.]|nr:hypothetical protein [Treponema sp.]